MPKVYRLILLETLEFSCCLYYNLYFLNLQEENSNFSYFLLIFKFRRFLSQNALPFRDF